VPEWDIYPHAIEDAFLRLSPRAVPQEATATEYNFRTGPIEPGVMYRGYVLSDYDLSLGSHITRVTKSPDDRWGHEIRHGVTEATALRAQTENSGDQEYCRAQKQKAPCAVTQTPRYYAFRGRKMWSSAGIIFDNPEYPSGRKCAWEDAR